MLTLTRRVGERIRIGNVTIRVDRIKTGSVRVSIDAPKDIEIVRTELEQPNDPAK